MLRPTCLVYAASLALVGCNFSDKEGALTDDPSNPHYKAAQQDIDNNNPSGAVAEYESALAHDPKLADAHYKMGLIYGDKLNDPVGAIYHFERFLALAPSSEKAAEVKGLIDKEGQAFAASLPNSTAQNSDETARLQNENTALKKQVDDASRTIAQLQTKLSHGHHHGQLAMQTPPPAQGPDASMIAAGPTPVIPVADTAAPVVDASTNATPAGPQRATAVDTNSPDVNTPPPTVAGTNGAPAAPTGPSRSYTVVKGDRVDRIAKKMYGAGHVIEGRDKIMAGNPGLDPKKLKIGQVLVIPQ